jgi:DNA polymerase-3 subunit delta'
MRSLLGRWKVAVIEDAHTMQPSAASALLKALEEPPEKTLWILVSSRKDQMLPTILSRCHAVAFRPMPEPLVRTLLEARGLATEEAARFASMAEGSPGLALRMRDAALPFPDSWISDPLAPFVLSENLPKELHLARPLVEGHLRLMAWHLRKSLGISTGTQSRRRERAAQTFSRSWADMPARRRRAFRHLSELSLALKSNVDPRLVVQAAALELQGAVEP